MATRKFHLSDILSVSLDKMVSVNGLNGVYKLVQFMTDASVDTTQLPRAIPICREDLLKQHPQLKGVDASSVNKSTHGQWLDEQIAKFGRELSVNTLPPGAYEHMDPQEELRQRRPDLPIVSTDQRN